MRTGKQKGMRGHGPRPGMSNAADPATVLQRGSFIRQFRKGWRGALALVDPKVETAGKATGVATRSAGAGRLFFYESSALSCRLKPPGRRERSVGISHDLRARRPAIQRTWCPYWGGFPVASTEVVVATHFISGSIRPRRCRAMIAVRASIPFLRMPRACGVVCLWPLTGVGAA